MYEMYEIFLYQLEDGVIFASGSVSNCCGIVCNSTPNLGLFISVVGVLVSSPPLPGTTPLAFSLSCFALVITKLIILTNKCYLILLQQFEFEVNHPGFSGHLAYPEKIPENITDSKDNEKVREKPRSLWRKQHGEETQYEVQ